MSSAQAKSFHSITIGEKNTWDDWFLVPSSRPLVSPPPPRVSYAELIGGDGSVDLTTNLTKNPTYGNRTGSWEFIVINRGQVPVHNGGIIPDNWTVRYSTIMAYLHGKTFDIILDDEPGFYYTGRLAVESWTTGSRPGNSTITISYNVDPYKRKVGDPSTKRF